MTDNNNCLKLAVHEPKTKTEVFADTSYK